MINPPPPELDYNGPESFAEIGQGFKRHFIDSGLKPGDRVLDVGCGLGRMAIPLTDYLTARGEYWGFDIVPSGIEWCKQNISSQFLNFNFFHANVFNKHYNPSGTTAAQNFKFPFQNDSFDFVFLTSVFTHMLALDVENYLDEIARVMRPGAKCLITFFLLNEESRALMAARVARFNFLLDVGGCLTADPAHPEAAIAYEERLVVAMYEHRGLKIIGPPYYGNWCGRKEFLSFQDIIVAEKG